MKFLKKYYLEIILALLLITSLILVTIIILNNRHQEHLKTLEDKAISLVEKEISIRDSEIEFLKGIIKSYENAIQNKDNSPVHQQFELMKRDVIIQELVEKMNRLINPDFNERIIRSGI